jgi:hypothetical protein
MPKMAALMSSIYLESVKIKIEIFGTNGFLKNKIKLDRIMILPIGFVTTGHNLLWTIDQNVPLKYLELHRSQRLQAP